MKHSLTILLSSLLLCCITSGIALSFPHSGTRGNKAVFGPKKFERSHGKPDTETVTFSIPEGGAGFTLYVRNSDHEGRHRVTSGTITLNGSEVVAPSDFHHHEGSIKRPVTLQQHNVLTVRLQGKPGSFLIIAIYGESASVEVPNVEGMSREAAEATVTSAGLSVGTISSQFSDTVPAGFVMSQDPPAGTSMPQGSPVNLVIALGHELATVPDVTGMTQASAESAITAAGLTIGGITSIPDTTTPAGQVMSQSPAPGTSVSLGAAVTLTVSLGPATTAVPNVTGLAQSAAEAAILAANLSIGEVANDYSSTVAPGKVISQTPAAGSSVAQGTAVSLVVSLGEAPPVVPPDPSTVAPPVDGTIATTVAASTEFLYTGANPIQTGVAPGTIEVRRAAVLRGQVSGPDGSPVPGVTITVLNHPEFGQTLTRTDGMFDLAVNGGAILTVNYRKDGYMPVQRQVTTPWNDFAWLTGVVMLPFDNQVTTVNLASSTPIQVARGSVSTDADGTRQATMFFSQGTSAQMVMPDGTSQPLTSLNIRATEYTVGPNGPKSMPAELPPTSAYTYAVELSADEAVTAGATEVRFDKPVFFYVENFLNFPVGGIVPAGFYDYRKAAWVPSDNGKIVKVLAINSGLAELDTDGSGQAADVTKLAALGITDAERQQLASLYAPGQSLWRVPMTHLTPWDCNWPWGPPEDAVPPNQPDPEQKNPVEDPDCKGGSVIECQNQTLGESISITGTPFTLNYRSDRVPGRKTFQTVKIPLSGSSVPASLSGIILKIRVAGRSYEYHYPASSNLDHEFIWDGLDAYGREVYGSQNVAISIGHKYGVVRYRTPAEAERAFSKAGGAGMTVNNARTLAAEVIFWQNHTTSLQYRHVAKHGLGAWSLNLHHVYDPGGKVLLSGDGSQRTAYSIGTSIITTVASNLDGPHDVAVGPDGSIFIAETWNSSIRRVGPDGIITTVAGNGTYDYSGDGGPATSAVLNSPFGVAVGPNGSIYIADLNNNRIRRIGPDGIITTVAGNGNRGYGGDGGPATSAMLNAPFSVRVGPDGSVYIADTYNNRIRRVGPDGIITTVAGNGNQGYGGDGGPAANAVLNSPYGVAVGPDGNIYISDSSNNRIRRVGPDGIITTVAGNGNGGDGGPAANAFLSYPFGVAVGPDGSIYISDGSRYIRRVSPDGIITTVAGNGSQNHGGDGGPATSAGIEGPTGLVVGPDESIFIAEYGIQNGPYSHIRRVGSAWPGVSLAEILIPSKDGSQLYVFNSSGKHLRTLNALTGATVFSFGYDSNGKLATVTDGDGNITSIERDSSGNPTAIVAPFGHWTTFSVDPNGYLSSITNPAGEAYRMTYTADGLLTSFTDPKGNASQFTYDESGLLTSDQNAVGGFSALFSTRSANSSLVTLTTALNRTTTYLTENFYNGQSRTITRPTGATSVSFIGANGTTETSSPDGTIVTATKTPDPRFGMLAPLESNTFKTPSGLTASLTKSRTVSLSVPGNPLSLASQSDSLAFNGRNYISVYTAATKQRTTTTPAGRQSFTLLDNLGRTRSFTPDPALTPVALNYDTRGRLTLISQGNLQSTYAYDTLGRVASISDAAGNTVQYGYDLADRVTRLTFPSGRSYNFIYDANGNNTRITMPNGAVHSLGYTAIDLSRDYTPPANPAYAWDYNLDQDWTGALLPSGRRIDAGYDDGGRLTARIYPEAGIGYHYADVTNRIQSIVRTSTNGGVSQGLTFVYDGGLVNGRNFSGVTNGNFTYTYDNNFLLTQIQLSSGSNSIVTPITRDADGLATGVGPFTFTRQGPAGAVNQITDPTMNIAVTYDSLGRVSNRTHTVNGQAAYAIQLAYDTRGAISRKTETVSGVTTTFEYAYDQDGQLIQVKKQGAAAEVFTYDVNGNRTSYERPGEWKVMAEFDGQDRIIGQGGVTYQFNVDGQMIQSGSETYLYSAMGELLQTTVDSETVIYSYDGTGRRIARTDSTGTWQYLYGNLDNPFQLTAMRDPAGVLSYYYYDNNGQLFAFDKGAARYYVASDQVGTPKVVTDATGTVVKLMEYDSFGMATFDSNPAFDIPVGFAGGITDTKTGLVRFGYRDYEPGTGRWTAKDPIFFGGGQGNLYGYVLNNPVNYIDPDGEFPWAVVVIGVPVAAWAINWWWDATHPPSPPPSRQCPEWRKPPKRSVPQSPGSPKNTYQPPAIAPPVGVGR
jgi:RHS repeat-associated protein